MLTNNFFIWVFMATACGVAGFALSKGTTKRVYFFSGIGAGIVVLAVGIWSVFFLTTDEKRIRATVESAAQAFEENDVEKGLGYFSQEARMMRQQAWKHMSSAELERVKISNFQVEEINRYKSPRAAIASFRCAVRGKCANQYWGAGPFTTLIDFTSVELREETPGEWKITDRIVFKQAAL